MVHDDCVVYGKGFGLEAEASGLGANVPEHAPKIAVKKYPLIGLACCLLLGFVFVAYTGVATIGPQLHASTPDPAESAQAPNQPQRVPTPTQHNTTQRHATQPNPTPRNPDADRNAPAERLTFGEFFAQLENRNQRRQELETSLVRYVELEHPTPILPDCPNLARQDLLDMGVLSSGKFLREPAPLNVSQTGPSCDNLFFSGPAFSENIIFDVILFSYELDILELRLHTLNRSVDKFVIVEFDVSHQGRKKLFTFGRNKNASRFQAFAAKIAHLPIGESSSFVRDSFATDEKGIFKIEFTHMRASIAAFQDYVRKEYGAIDHNRLLYHFSHADEILHPSSLYKIKHCVVKNNVLPFGNVLWFVMSDLRYAFRSDHSAPQLPYSLVTMNIIDLVFPADKRIGIFSTPRNYLVGGWHMTGSLYPPFAALKELTATEASHEFDIREAGLPRFSAIMPGRENRMVLISSLVQTEHVVAPVFYEPPAYAQCNHERYEIWYTRQDRRSALRINP